MAKDNSIKSNKNADRLALGAKSILVMDVVKNRHGSTGKFDSFFDGSRSRVKDLGYAG
jgi:hypothetical protein